MVCEPAPLLAAVCAPRPVCAGRRAGQQALAGRDSWRRAPATHVSLVHNTRSHRWPGVSTDSSINLADISPRTDGEADIRPPRRFCVDSGKTAERSAAKFDMTIPSSLLHNMCNL